MTVCLLLCVSVVCICIIFSYVSLSVALLHFSSLYHHFTTHLIQTSHSL